MNISKPNYFLQLPLAVIILSLTFVSQTQAEPTVRLTDGSTTVQLSTDLVDALGTLNVTPGVTEPGTLTDDGVATFPIVSGALDLESSIGEISHTGGLTLTSADESAVVDLFDFIIDNTGDQLVMTGLAGLNDDLAGRFPLFTLDFSTAQVDTSDTDLTVTGVVLGLTAEGAAALNAAFGVTAFTEGINIGTANVDGVLAASPADDETDTPTDDSDTPADDSDTPAADTEA